MRKIILGLFLILSTASYSQRIKENIDAKNIKASGTISAPIGNFGVVTGIPATYIDNANGILGDSLWIKKNDTTLQFVKLRTGLNTRMSYEGDSVLIFNSSQESSSQVFSPKPGEAAYTATGYNSSIGGTVTARTPAVTNVLTALPRVAFVSAATASSVVYYSSVDAPALWRGSALGQGGFNVLIRTGFGATTSNAMAFIGLWNTNITTSVDPSTQINIIGVGKDGADATLQIMYNNEIGTATKVNTGMTISTSTAYEIRIVCEPFSTAAANATITVKDLTTGTSFSSTVTTNLPTTFLKWGTYLSNNTTASSVALDLIKVYAESRY